MRPIPTTPTRIDSGRLRRSLRYTRGPQSGRALRWHFPGVPHSTSEGGSCNVANEGCQVRLVSAGVPENGGGGRQRHPPPPAPPTPPPPRQSRPPRTPSHTPP